MNTILEALQNPEFGDRITQDGYTYLVLEKYPDKTATAIRLGDNFPAPVYFIQLEPKVDGRRI